MVIFIIPKNSRIGQKCKEIAFALGYLENAIDSDYRAEDIPSLLEDLLYRYQNVVALTGEDLFEEYRLASRQNLSVLQTFSWDDEACLYREPTLCLLGPKNKSLEDLPQQLRIAINVKYKNIAERYLQKLEKDGYIFERRYMNGATEKRYVKNLADVIIEIVYSGKSAQACGLQPYAPIFSGGIILLGKQRNKNEDELTDSTRCFI